MLNEIEDEVTRPESGYQPLKKDINALNERVTEVELDLDQYKKDQNSNISTGTLQSVEAHHNSVDASIAAFGTAGIGKLTASAADITNASIANISGTVGIDKAVIGELELVHPNFERLNVTTLHADAVDTTLLDIDELKANKISSDIVMQDVSAGTVNAESVIAEDVETSSIESGSIHNDGLLSTGDITVANDIEVGDRVKARDIQAGQAELNAIDVLTIKNSKNTRNEKSFINLHPVLQTIDDYYVVKVPNTKGLIQMEASDGCWNMTIIKNGRNSIVAYSEASLDKIPVIRYTEGGDIYFSVKCDGQINYVFDRTVVLGNNTVENGLTVMGQLEYVIGPEEVDQLVRNLNLKGQLRFVNPDGTTEIGEKGFYVASDENGEPHWVEPSDHLDGTLSDAVDRLVTERTIAAWDGSSLLGKEFSNNITKLGKVTEGEWAAGKVTTSDLNATEAVITTLSGNEASITTVNAHDVDVENGVGHENTSILFDRGVNADTIEYAAANNKFSNIEVSGTLNATANKAKADKDGNQIDTTYIKASTKGEANGVASLDANGKLPLAQLPTEAIVFKGMWNASTNSPALADGTGTSGDYYIVSVGGTRNLGSGNITFVAGDGIIYDGSKWNRKADTNLVQSVNGNTGVVLVKYLHDFTATSFTEGVAPVANFWNAFPVGLCESGSTINGHNATAIIMKKSSTSGSLMILDNTDNSVYLAQMGKPVTSTLR
ncbi:unnamed protein product [Cylicocyclus nassatus]|uniref:Uncharacterized protein n=1 Tax=Cylicocyclus nassatus TaxID=53992 RepID=A0AA36HH41_CYLNA|nr:unnamed protein product [Cylicocyclus nassatus]